MEKKIKNQNKSDYVKTLADNIEQQSAVIDDYNEQNRLTYYNPFKNQDYSKARMYWSSSAEVWGRSLILIGFILNIALSLFFGRSFLNHIFEVLKVESILGAFHLSVLGGATLLMVIIAITFMLFFYLPMIICRTSGFVHGWGIFYIVMAIVYFIAMETFFALSLALSKTVAIFESSINTNYAIYFIIITLIITLIWLTGACLLVVKSDDVRRNIHVE